MIENARRQVILVLLVTAAALFFALKEKPSLGLDLSGGTQLIYEVDIKEAREKGLVDIGMSDDQVMTDTLRIIADRIDPTGTRDPVITRRGEFQFMIELPDVGETEAEIIRRQIETLGRLEMRLVATEDYRNGAVKFSLSEEKKNLEDWLNEGDHRAVVQNNPERIDDFNTLALGQGRLSPHLLWYPAKIFPSYRDEAQWDFASSRQPGSFSVAAYTPQDYATPPPAWSGDENKPYLVEFYPINMDAVSFAGEDMNAAGVRAGNDYDTGRPCVFYELKAEKKTPYADWSEENIGEASAIVLNGMVRSAPTFQGRIYGEGRIVGSFTVQEAADLAKVIQTGSLQVKPQPISSVSIGATLGQRSIELGMYSVGIGGLLVLVFILAYYRLAGLVAFSAIALNVLLIFGVVQFIRATITLPGIAGLVLTMGMAVDANILIYERIREELRKGKELLQAVRTGFDRAMVTILDANITTFIAGVVLYNVGVGPVRGFAVTLMVGILTSLFTAFMVTRLIFHFLLERKILTEFKAASWFTGLSFNFLSRGRLAMGVSLIAIVLGLGYTTTVPADEMLGLDFTGGASLALSLEEPMTERDLKASLKADAEFTKQFPAPQITRQAAAGEKLVGDKASQFSIKMKLKQAQRDELDRLRELAKANNEPYEPPFKQLLLAISGLPFVPEAFTEVGKAPLPDSTYAATATVHFSRPVNVDDIRAALRGTIADKADAASLPPGEDAAKTIGVEFPVRSTETDAQIEDRIAISLKDVVDATGEPVTLSNPIPSAEVIGSRMVGELRTAAIGAMVLSLFLIVMYIRVRFHEYKYGVGAVAALIHDVLITFAVVVAANHFGIVNAEIGLPMIAAFLTIIGYSINDTIVIFDRVRENLTEQQRLGDSKETFAQLINRSINQTLSRTILTSGTTLFVVLAVFLVNRNSGSDLEGFAFALIIGIISGTYSTIFIASPVVLWLRNREGEQTTAPPVAKTDEAEVPVETGV